MKLFEIKIICIKTIAIQINARSFYVGDAVKKEDIHAKFEDGILHIVLPAPQQQKALPANPNLIEIE